jgi:hypothetical protein
MQLDRERLGVYELALEFLVLAKLGAGPQTSAPKQTGPTTPYGPSGTGTGTFTGTPGRSNSGTLS